MQLPEYRAWDFEEKEMLLFHSFKDFCNAYQSIEGNIILSQYTGLKDKNGVKIFAGDIMQGKILGYDFVGQVKRSNSYGFRLHGKMSFSSASSGGSYGDTVSITKVYVINHAKNLSSIGDIYRNPELLNSKE